MTVLNTRLTGLASISAALCLAIGGGMHLLLHNASGHWIYYFGYILLAFAITGLYGAIARQSGLLGLAGYVVYMIGILIGNISAFLILADVTGSAEAHAVFMYMYADLNLYLPGIYTLLVGQALFGLAILYSRVLPRYAGALLVLGVLADLPAELVASLYFMWYVSILLTGGGLIWLGAHLLRRPAAESAALPEVQAEPLAQ
jgi:hypothetical protein